MPNNNILLIRAQMFQLLILVLFSMGFSLPKGKCFGKERQNWLFVFQSCHASIFRFHKAQKSKLVTTIRV